MVGGSPWSARVEIRHIVVATGVLHGDGLVGIDVPHPGTTDHPHGRRVGEDVVQGTQPSTVLEGRRARSELLDDLGVAGVLDLHDRILHAVGVEVTEQEHRLAGELLGAPVDQCLGLDST